MAIDQAFLWGQNGRKLTSDQIDDQRKIAAALMKQGMDFSPVGHWTQGLARVAQGVMGAIDDRVASSAEKDNGAYNESVINSLLGGSAAPGITPAASPQASIGAPGAAAELAGTSPAAAGGPDAYRNAIASIESAGSGDYAAIGPTHPKLGRALGRYQIMEANIGPWSQEALGRAVTPDEFMADTKLQDAIFDKKFNGYVQQYGPEGAAQAWIGGPGGVGKLRRKDSLGTSVGAYGSKFLNALGPQVASATPQAAIEAVAPAPGYVDPMVSAPNSIAAPSPAPIPTPRPDVTMGGRLGAAQPLPDAEFNSRFDGAPAAGQAPEIYTQGVPDLPPPATVGPTPYVATAPDQQAPAASQQVAQALTTQQPQQQATGINPAILRALSDPRSSPQTRAVAQALMQQGFQRQQSQQEMQMKQADPRYQQQLQLGQLEIEKARNPGVDGVAVGNRIIDRRTGKVIYEAPGASQSGFRQATPEEATKYGAAAGQFGPDGRFYPLNPPQGTSLTVDPTTGAVSFNQGAGVKPLTESQSKDTVFATRATNSLPLLNQYEDALLSLPESAAGAIPMNLGNYLQSEQYQLARDAGRDFLATVLRKDSGAAITENEEKIYGQLFLPQPGDKTGTISAKKQRRAIAVEAIKAGMPASAIESMTKAIQSVPPSTEIQTDIPGVKIRKKSP